MYLLIHGSIQGMEVDLIPNTHLTSKLPDLLDPVIEGKNLRGAHEGKVQGVEEEDEVLPPVVAELNLRELTVDHRGAGKVGGGLGDHGLGHLDVVAAGPGLSGGGSPRAIITSLRGETHRDEHAQVHRHRGGEHDGSENGENLGEKSIFRLYLCYQKNLSEVVTESTFPGPTGWNGSCFSFSQNIWFGASFI